jgi:high-affinity iron transporter
MLGAGIIVFRETLEAALIVSIVMAATLGVPGRNRWVGLGLLAGLLGALLVAASAATISAAAAGMGQELFNAAVLLTAVVMLGWHTVWMSSHGRALASEARALGKAVLEGTRPLWALAVVVGVAVLREGSETVLFLYGIAAGGEDGASALLIGGLAGVAGGAVLGAALYFGLLRIPMRHLFTLTNWMVMLLAAGMASQAAHFLVQADTLPPLGDTIWDTSFLVDDGSIPGKVLHTLVGYVAEPSGIQLLFWAGTLIAISLTAQAVSRSSSPPARATS